MSNDLKDSTSPVLPPLGIVGCGKMGQAMLEGFIRSQLYKPDQITVSCRTESTKQTLQEKGVRVTFDNTEIFSSNRVVILSVEPGQVSEVLQQYGSKCSQTSQNSKMRNILISVCAGIEIQTIKKKLSCPDKWVVVWAMPNICCAECASLIPYATSTDVNDEEAILVERILNSLGSSIKIAENLMGVAIALSGSSPAYFYVMLEAMIDAGVCLGLPRATATQLSIQSMNGTGKLIVQKQAHPTTLKEKNTSPGGTTIAALMELEKHGFRHAVISAVKKCHERFIEMMNEFRTN